jgi:hypothetical protein
MKRQLQRWLALGGLLFCAAATPTARAEVVYRPDHNKAMLGLPHEAYQLDLNGDSVNDVEFNHSTTVHAGMVIGPSSGTVRGLNGAAVAAEPPHQLHNALSHFAPGETVGPSTAFSTFSAAMTDEDTPQEPGWSFFDGPQFMGLRFNIGPNTHYAVIELYMETDAPPPGVVPLAVGSFAYETQPNTPIIVPEPTSITALAALLATRLTRRRRRR